MNYLLAKALHLIAVISWFAGLFYIVRLFIYDVEANNRPENERDLLQAQLRLMAGRLWNIITVPAMVATTVFGGWLLLQYVHHYGLADSGWLHGKLAMLVGLYGYHFTCGRLRRQLLAGTCSWSGNRLRMFNEVATLLMVGIVCTAVLKRGMAGVWGIGGMLALGVLLMLAVRLYRRHRAA